jgi:hypothetical protein
MRTTIFKNGLLKSSILFLGISTFMLSALLFTSCSDSESMETTDDTALITKIESAAKVSIDASNLPANATAVFNSDLADSYIESVQLASGLGYKVAIVSDDQSKEEAKSDVYFSEKGRELNDMSEKGKRRKHKCFEFVFPIDFIMPDDTSITLESKEDWILIKTFYEENPDASERPSLVFPVDVTLEDGTIQTLLDSDELNTVKDSCKRGKDKRKCFRLVLPVSFTMPDATVIDVAEKSDFKLIKEWHKANPAIKERAALIFPVDIEFKDGTVANILDQTSFDEAKESCKN